jgi:hypothetical protein
MQHDTRRHTTTTSSTARTLARFTTGLVAATAIVLITGFAGYIETLP